MDKIQLLEDFYSRYGNREKSPVLFFSPGRVNLIGEHTDYNSGYVLPCAINYGTWLAIRPNNIEKFQMASMDFSLSMSFDFSTVREPVKGSWTNYPGGVINEFLNLGIKLNGCDMLFAGNIPNGAGLSSSASIEMATAIAFNQIFNGSLSTMDLVKLCQHAENSFVGMNCGIMDQFAVGFGRKDNALFINCGTLEYKLTPFNQEKYRLVISNTNKRRGLTDSKYNERRAECESAVRLLQPFKRIASLTDLTVDDIPFLGKYINNEVIIRRAKHIITENARVLKTVEMLQKGYLDSVGALMNESHDSLRDDYEVTGFELDTMVNEALKLQGVVGSRMTGAGFGGCTVSLVEREYVLSFAETLSGAYESKTGLKPAFYFPEISSGAAADNWQN